MSMKIFFNIVGVVGLLFLVLAAACRFVPQDNTENAAMAQFIALFPLGIGATLCLVALIGRLA